MDVTIEQDGIMIRPETKFEENFLRHEFYDKDTHVFLKHGSSISDMIGLKLITKDKEVIAKDEE